MVAWAPPPPSSFLVRARLRSVMNVPLLPCTLSTVAVVGTGRRESFGRSSSSLSAGGGRATATRPEDPFVPMHEGRGGNSAGLPDGVTLFNKVCVLFCLNDGKRVCRIWQLCVTLRAWGRVYGSPSTAGSHNECRMGEREDG